MNLPVRVALHSQICATTRQYHCPQRRVFLYLK
jgi:hypothetical protein